MANKLFTPSQARKLSDAQARKEYSKLRSIANKRIKRLVESGYSDDSSLFPTVEQVQTGFINMATALADVSSYIRNKRNTVKGARQWHKYMIGKFEAAGYGGLIETIEGFKQYTKYMEYLRQQYSDKVFDSGDARDVYAEGQRLNIPVDQLKENYELWATNLDKMEKLRKSPHGREFSQKRIDKLIKKWK